MATVAKDYNGILTKGLEASLATTPIEDGRLRYTTDTGRVYLDSVTGDNVERITISDVIQGYTEAEILALGNPLPKFYFASDNGHLYVYNNVTDEWFDLSALFLTEDTTSDGDMIIWFSDTDSKSPMYNSNFTYNPKTGSFKVTKIVADSAQIGGMNITVSVEGNKRLIEFTF